MKTKIYIVRHSETDYNIDHRHDHEWKAIITEEWQIRAKKISELLSSSNISVIYSSPLQRCIDTITPLANKLWKQVQVDKRLRETFFRDIQDRLWNDFSRDFLDKIHDINENEVEWCEHMSDVQKRVAECLDSIIEIHKWKNIVICSHASPILQLLAHIDSWSPDCSPAKVPNNKWISHEDAYILREI